MNCPLCSANIPAGSKFCEQCGTPLPRSCAACGHANSLKAKFCSQCGAGLSTASKPVEAAPRPKPAPITAAVAAERRQLTVMFCDMVDSSALSTRLDPEEQREVVSSFQGYCAAEIKRLDGMVAQFLGDGVRH